MNSEFASSDEFGSYFEDEFYVDAGKKEIATFKSSTFQNRVRIPYFHTLRKQRIVSRKVRLGELCSRERPTTLARRSLKAEVSRLGFCRLMGRVLTSFRRRRLPESVLCFSLE